jgi:hypothetical protein
MLSLLTIISFLVKKIIKEIFQFHDWFHKPRQTADSFSHKKLKALLTSIDNTSSPGKDGILYLFYKHMDVPKVIFFCMIVSVSSSKKISSWPTYIETFVLSDHAFFVKWLYFCKKHSMPTQIITFSKATSQTLHSY